MGTEIESAVVRILGAAKSKKDTRRSVVGGGFLVGKNHVLTCAHVITQALDLDPQIAYKPEGPIIIDFPLVAPGNELKCSVEAWFPITDGNGDSPNHVEDIAVLKLTDDPPQGSRAARPIRSDDLWQHPFRSFGFPEGEDGGIWATGSFLGRQASGWIQLGDNKTPGFSVVPGFSGVPVRDEKLDGIVGMVVASERQADIKAAFIIPTAILQEAWAPLKSLTIPPSPYRGLTAFQEEDHQFFFGRKAFVDDLLRVVRGQSLTMITGASGIGKSSLVYAGLIPRLRRTAEWIIASFRPGERPFHSLAACLIPILEPTLNDVDLLNETPKLASTLEAGTVELRDIVSKIINKHGQNKSFLLVADQFEELYTGGLSEAQRRRTIEQLLSIAKENRFISTSSIRLVITIRADFLNYVLDNRRFADALQASDRRLLAPMNREELREAIEEPAHLLNIRLEAGLTERILDDIENSPGNLPLLEFALSLLWALQEDSSLTHAAYNSIGGVEKALASYAEALYGRLSDEDQKRVQKILIQLVNPLQGRGGTRRVANRRELGEENWKLVSRLADARLVVTSVDKNNANEIVEIAHETLITSWERLRDWMAGDSDFRTWQERLRPAISDWIKSGRSRDALLHGYSLVQSLEWSARRNEDISKEERSYIVASEAERQRQKRVRRLINQIAVISACILSVLGILAIVLNPYSQSIRHLAPGEWSHLSH